mmetsp:Transcript_49826/g.81992  ORF Transcript_49826/g.81992 Transcript_49826/m.81992 type:complete len:120 (+) Transcript_49826:318-677(+)
MRSLGAQGVDALELSITASSSTMSLQIALFRTEHLRMTATSRTGPMQADGMPAGLGLSIVASSAHRLQTVAACSTRPMLVVIGYHSQAQSIKATCIGRLKIVAPGTVVHMIGAASCCHI